MAVATTEQLRKPRTKTVKVEIDGEPVEFVIRKAKVGDQRRLSDECVSPDGSIDTDRLYCLTAQMCVVEPALTDEDIDEIDGDVFVALSVLIANHSGVSDAVKLIVPDPEEGSGVVKSFPAA